MFNLIKKNYKLQITLIIISLAVIIFLFSLLLQYHLLYNENKDLILNNGNKTIERKYTYIKTLMKRSDAILHSMNKSLVFQNYLKNKDDNKELLTLLFSFAMENNKDFMQFRYINKNGQEEIRVQRDSENNTVYNVENNLLQNKSTRNYFYKSINKPYNKVWYSEINLNIENGEIEIPFNPTFRTILPIEKDGNFEGILIINYFMKSFLKFLSTSPTYDIILANKKGDTITHFNPEKSWGVFPNRNFNLENLYDLNLSKLNLSETFIGNNFLLKELNLPIDKGLLILLKTNQIYIDLYNYNFLKKAFFDIILLLFIIIIATTITTKIVNKILHELTEAKVENEDIKQIIQKEVEKCREKDMIISQQNKHVSMGQMIENIAHQWRQPLSEINSLVFLISSLLNNETINKKKLIKKLDEIEGINEYLSQTIDDFGKFLNYNIKNKETFSLQECVKKALNIIDITLKKNNIQVILDFRREIYITNYANELQQSILSLLNNAKDALIDNHTKNSIIEIAIRDNNTHYQITIEDNGGGIEESLLEKVFEPYFTTKHPSKGTGLGLFITKMIIETSIKGELIIENKNQGTCCTINIKKGNLND